MESIAKMRVTKLSEVKEILLGLSIKTDFCSLEDCERCSRFDSKVCSMIIAVESMMQELRKEIKKNEWK